MTNPGPQYPSYLPLTYPPDDVSTRDVSVRATPPYDGTNPPDPGDPNTPGGENIEEYLPPYDPLEPNTQNVDGEFILD